MNEWDKVGAPFENFARRAPRRPVRRPCQYDRWGWNADHRRMVADHANELNDAVEYEVERRRGGR